MVAWWILIAVSIALSAVQYLLRPKVAKRSDITKDLENPTAEAGKPVPILFGTVTIKGLNVLWYGNKSSRTYKVKA